MSPNWRTAGSIIGTAFMLAVAIQAWAEVPDWLGAGDLQEIDARWDEFAAETDPVMMQRQERVLRGTIDDYLRGRPYMKILARITSGVVYTTTQSPERAWLLAQVKSVQGNDIVLGPLRLPFPVRKAGDERNWVYPAITLPFDETKHYAALYIDRRNRVDTFAIYERRPDEPMPVAVIFTPREVPNPVLVTESENQKQRWIRGFLMVLGYGDFEIVRRNLNWMRDDGKDVGAMIVVMPPVLFAVLILLYLYMRNRKVAAIYAKGGYRRDDELLRSRSFISKFFYMPWRCPHCGNRVQSFTESCAIIYLCQRCKIYSKTTAVLAD